MAGNFDISQLRNLASGATSAAPGGDTVLVPSSWLAEVGQSFKGLVFGLVLVPAAWLALMLGEGYTIGMDGALEEAGRIAVSAKADVVDPALDGRLVHVAGAVSTPTPVVDDAFAMSAKGLRLERTVEMMQWQEDQSKQTTDQGRQTVYRYSKVWSAKPIASRSFRSGAHGESHANPPMPIAGKVFPAAGARIGAYGVGPGLIAALPQGRDLAVSEDVAAAVGRSLSRPARIHGDTVFVGADPADPAIGDLRIGYRLADPAEASALGQQSGDGLAPFTASNGSEIAMLRGGIVSSRAMIDAASAENGRLRWIIRITGALVLWLGFFLVLGPLVAIADGVPLLGSIVGAGAALAALVATLVTAPVAVALAWLWNAPLFSLGVVMAAATAGLALSRGIAAIRRRRRATSA